MRYKKDIDVRWKVTLMSTAVSIDPWKIIGVCASSVIKNSSGWLKLEICLHCVHSGDFTVHICSGRGSVPL